MTIPGASRTGTSEDCELTETGEENDKRPDDELESDPDHREMIRSYACDAYLSRWLPDAEDERLPDNLGTSRHCNGTKPGEVERERHCTTPVLRDNDTSDFISPSHNQRHHETDESRDAKVCNENGRKTYFEAIKCSTIKPRQPAVVTHKRSKIDESFVVPQPTHNPAEEKTPTSKDLVRPCVVQMTSNRLGQLGSLCFKTTNATERRNEVLRSSRHIIGGKMRKVHRSLLNAVSSDKRNRELLVRCESVMIYPKALVCPRNEKPSSEPLKAKEAWRENYIGATSLAFRNEEEYTRLPDLEAKERPMLLDKQDRKLSPGPVQGENDKHLGNVQNSRKSASTKIIIPFGEVELKSSNNRNVNPETLAMQKAEELQGSETKPYQATSAFFSDLTSARKRANFYNNRNASQLNSSEKFRRTIPGMVIGVTRLEIPRKARLITRSLSTAAASSPLTKFNIRAADANGLSQGPLNVSQKNPSSRFFYNQRKRPDFSMKTKDQSPIITSDQEGRKYFISAGSNLSLKVGGTGLLKEQRSLQVNFGGGRQMEDTNRKTAQFNTVVPRSRYFT